MNADVADRRATDELHPGNGSADARVVVRRAARTAPCAFRRRRREAQDGSNDAGASAPDQAAD